MGPKHGHIFDSLAAGILQQAPGIIEGTPNATFCLLSPGPPAIPEYVGAELYSAEVGHRNARLLGKVESEWLRTAIAWLQNRARAQLSTTPTQSRPTVQQRSAVLAPRPHRERVITRPSSPNKWSPQLGEISCSIKVIPELLIAISLNNSQYLFICALESQHFATQRRSKSKKVQPK